MTAFTLKVLVAFELAGKVADPVGAAAAEDSIQEREINAKSRNKNEPSGLAFLRENETAPVSKTLTSHNRGSVFSACARTSIRGFLGNSALFSGTDLISRNLGRSGMGSAKNFSEP